MLNGGFRLNQNQNQNQNDTPDMPLVSIITVVYNSVRFLEATIQSVLGQNYDNIEYIIIDGDSYDGTLEIIKKYEDKIAYWQSEPDQGIYDAMNKGLSLAAGTWINFMNAGDRFYSPEVVKNFVNEIRPSDQILYGDAVTLTGKRLRKHPPSKFNFMFERMICHQSIFAKKEVFENNVFDTNYRIVADRKWLARNFFGGKKIRCIPYVINYYDFTGVSSDRRRYDEDSKRLQKELFGMKGVFIYVLKRIMMKILKKNT